MMLVQPNHKVLVMNLIHTGNESIHARREDILNKQSLIEQARNALRKEFVGIDKVIDEVLNSISPWFFFPDIQEKPLIINLWGMTGVGKTSLVTRIVDLLSCQDRFFQINLRECSGRYRRSLDESIISIHRFYNGKAFIISLDEFQYASDESTDRSIWTLLDNGILQHDDYDRVNDISYYLGQLRFYVKKGIRVENGIVITNAEEFYRRVYGQDSHLADSSVVYFVKWSIIQSIYQSSDYYSCPEEIADILNRMNEKETIDFLHEFCKIASRPITIDCTKACVFVLGNLDDAYSMAKDFNPDMSADEFHTESMKITVPMIKSALSTHFRAEQIARLGNNHIIYPAFSSESFRKIIAMELEAVTKKVLKYSGFNLEIDPSVYDLLYDEGVYPTQGTRPVFSTIHLLVSAKLSRIIGDAILQGLCPTNILMRLEDEFVVVNYMVGESVVHSIRFKQETQLKELREAKRNDIQAISAVHESGHIVVAAVLLNRLPEYSLSSTASPLIGGLTIYSQEWPLTRKTLIACIAHKLAGYKAEEIVFGWEYLTGGSRSDIREVREFTEILIKECGFGAFPGELSGKSPLTNTYLNYASDSANKEVDAIIAHGLELAEQTLWKEKRLLLMLADHLSDNRIVDKEQIRTYIRLYGSRPQMADDVEDKVYRRRLKEAVAGVNGMKQQINKEQSDE